MRYWQAFLAIRRGAANCSPFCLRRGDCRDGLVRIAAFLAG